mgnify:CR=1 FL=1
MSLSIQRLEQTGVALREALAEPRYPSLLQRFADWLGHRAWRERCSDEQWRRLAEPAPVFATPLLERDHRRVVKQGDSFAALLPEERLALRIRV